MDNQNRNIYYNLELLQAISNWQAGSNEKKGNKLKNYALISLKNFVYFHQTWFCLDKISLDNVGLSRFFKRKKAS